MDNRLTGIGIITTAIAQEHIFTFMLSSCLTARTIAKEKNQIDEVKRDLNISLALSLGIGVLTAILLKNINVFIFSVVFSFLLYEIYKVRGEIP